VAIGEIGTVFANTVLVARAGLGLELVADASGASSTFPVVVILPTDLQLVLLGTTCAAVDTHSVMRALAALRLILR